MTSRTLEATLPIPAAEVLAVLDDLGSFPRHAADVLSVTDTGGGGSDWVLAFRGRTVTWTQLRRRHVEGDRTRIEFEQVDGDFARLRGSWTVSPTCGGAAVAFDVEFGTNVANLAGAVDSAAGRVLVRTAADVLAAAGPVEILRGASALRDLVGPAGLERSTHDAVR